ncbi:MAG: DUF2993 domain-containing protein [Mojavia pulchra JT2-VF2]|jgi:hypothetical protein|uniref:DUF2993 domain-containing protein n=1 Tax=Mojavia pulchra JT2-VF2 TaxID=287848 RepID=A0A951Q5P9_9NOST|nr:DUF2993 domain-containing protein [Mojavia pulchra JT2-VF2]
MPDKHSLEEELLAQAAENRLTDQLDEVEKIDVDVKTDLFKIVQGEVDEVSLTGQGLVFQQDIRVQEIKIQTDSFAVNPLSALLGQIELNEPVNAIARIVMTETDINRAFSSEFIQSQMQSWDLNVEGEIVTFNLKQIQLSLPGNGKIEFRLKVMLTERGNSRPLGFTAIIRPPLHPQPLLLESFNCTEGEGLSIETITALMQKLKELQNLPYFEWDNTLLRIKDMQVQKENLILLVEVNMKQIPSS